MPTPPSDQPLPAPRKPTDPAPGLPAEPQLPTEAAPAAGGASRVAGGPPAVDPQQTKSHPQVAPPQQRSWILPPDATFKPALKRGGAAPVDAPTAQSTGLGSGAGEAPVAPSADALVADGEGAEDGRSWFCRAWPWAVIFLAALALRGVYLGQVREIPFFDTLVGDAASYDAWAQDIAEGDWLGDTAFYQAPAYPYFLGVLYRVLGRDLLMVRVVQGLLGATACLLLGFAGVRFFGRSAGLVTAAILAIYPPAIFFDGLIQKTSLGLFWMALLLWLLGVQQQRPKGWRWLLVGVVLGLFALTRENALVLAVVIVGWVLFAYHGSTWQRRRNWAAAVVAGLLIVFYPVAFRNYCVGGVWATTTVQAGPNFYIGNHAGATGRYTPLVRGHESPPFERADARLLAEAESGKALGDLDVSRFWLGKSWEFIRTEPREWLRLMGHKVLLTVNHYEITDTEGFNVYRDWSWALQMLAMLLGFGVIAPLASAGAVLTLYAWRRVGVLHLMTAAMVLAVAAFYVFARYRFPLVPLLILFAAAGAAETVRRLQARRYGVLIAAGGVALVAGLASSLHVSPEQQLDAMAYANLGGVLAQRGDIEASKTFFAMAIEESPQSPEPYYSIGMACRLQGDNTSAIGYLLKAKQLAPGMAEVDYQLAVAFEADGNPHEALRYYRAAMERNPHDLEAAAAIERLQTPTNDR